MSELVSQIVIRKESGDEAVAGVRATWPAPAKLPDHDAQRALLESLRYRQYVRAGTLGEYLLHIRTQVEQRSGFWYWVSLAAMAAQFAWLSSWTMR